jgi:hypothetical protein
MWSREAEQNAALCEAAGEPVGWRVVCHSCGHRFPIVEGERPFSGGACALKCCGSPRHRVHDLRIPCEWCEERSNDNGQSD